MGAGGRAYKGTEGGRVALESNGYACYLDVEMASWGCRYVRPPLMAAFKSSLSVWFMCQ